MEKILNHILALQILIPIFSGFIIALIKKPNIPLYLFRFASFLSFISSIIIFISVNQTGSMDYAFGGFTNNIGIVFRIDYLNAPLIFLTNLLLCSAAFLIFDKNDKFTNFVYSLILISYTGIFGILLTGDLFNLYVFLEIYSLASAALFACGRNFTAAFYYLIINTIAATLILLSIGFLLAATGHLNMTEIYNALVNHYNSKIIMAACVIYAVAVICKSSIFPMYFWSVQAYEKANAKIWLLLSAISSNIGIYLLVRYGYFVVDYQKFFISYHIQLLLQTLGIGSVIYGCVMAYLETNFRKIIIWSSVASMGYFAILFSILEADAFCYGWVYNITDTILKISLIAIVILHEEMGSFGYIRKDSILLKSLVVISIISSLGLPITMGFFNKLHFLRITLYSTHQIIFIISIFASIFAVSYHYRIIHNLMFDELKTSPNPIFLNWRFKLFIAFFTILSYVILLYNDYMLSYYSQITDIIFASDGS